MTVAITRMERTAAELRRYAACSANASVARRPLALALILDGHKREDAARAAGMDRQTLCDRVHRYNADGIAGLGDRHGGDAQPRLSPEQEAEVADWIRTGPDVEVDGVVRWRCVDIQARIAREWGVALHERSVGKLLHRLRFARVSTRPRHPKADPAKQASFGPGSPPRANRPRRFRCDCSPARNRAGCKDARRGLAPRRGPSRKRFASRRVGQLAETA